jgi:hypothetical protein
MFHTNKTVPARGSPYKSYANARNQPSSHADSLLRYANGYLTANCQERNNLTQLLYLHLYKNADLMEAANLLQEIELRFQGDSLINTARDLYRYYVDIENGGYVNKAAGRGTQTASEKLSLPASFTLKQNYPNPFNPVTTIEYIVHQETTVRLLITDVYGRKVRETRPAYQLPGEYRYTFDGGSLPSGMYLATLLSKTQSATIRMILIK